MAVTDNELDPNAQAKNIAKAEFMRGLAIVVFGFVATFISYKLSSSTGGSTYLVAGGAFIIGGYQLFHGLYLLLHPKAALKQLQSGKQLNPATSALKVIGVLFALVIIAAIIVNFTRKDDNAKKSVFKQQRQACNAQYADLNSQSQANSKLLISTPKDNPEYAALSTKQQTLDKQILDKYNECAKL